MMTKVKFTEDCSVEAQGEIVQRFKAGEVVEMSMASARHWINRNKADEIQGKSAGVQAKLKRGKPVVDKAAAEKSDGGDIGGRSKPITATSGTDETSPDNSNK